MIAQQDYPPPPWRLNATAYLAIWRISIHELALRLDAALQPLRLARHVIAAAGFVNYGQGSVVEYNELFLALLARGAGRTGVTIPRIWVDSAISLRAGRELWGIPKQPASFRKLPDGAIDAAASITEEPIARIEFRPGSALPFRLPLKLTVLQPSEAGVQCTPVAASSAVSFGTSKWTIPSGSPLELLRGRRPLVSMQLRNARIRFGA